MKRSIAILLAVCGLAVTGRAQTTNTFPASPSTNSLVATGPVTGIAGPALNGGLSWIAQHGAIGTEYSGSIAGRKYNGGDAPSIDETGWFADAAWTNSNNGTTNIDLKAGLLHADVIQTKVTVDQFGLETQEAFFNQNLVLATAKVPVVHQIVGFLKKFDAEITESIAENTDELGNGRLSEKKTNWGVGFVLIKLY